MATATGSRAVFWWCFGGLALAMVVGITSIPTVTLEAAAEEPAPSTVPEEPPVAFFSEGPDHNPCAYPHDCRPGHVLTTLECGEVGATRIEGTDSWYITGGGYRDLIDPECRPYVISYWDSNAPDGIATCRLLHTLYQNREVVTHNMTRSTRNEGEFIVELDNAEGLLFEFIVRCTSDNNPDYPHVISTEWRQFYR